MDLLEEVRQARLLLDPATARSIRESAGVSQSRLAQEVGVDRTTLIRWEAGTTTPRGAQRSRYLELLDGLQREMAS